MLAASKARRDLPGWVQGLGFRAQEQGLRIYDLGFRIEGAGFRI